MTRFAYTLMFVTSLMGWNLPAYSESAAYGPSITLDNARRVAASAAELALKNNYRVAIAIVDTSGHLVYFEKLDDTQTASIDVAIAKARSASNFKRETKIFETALAAGRTAILGLQGAVPLEGGVPLMQNGRIVGAIGVSGVTSEQDGQVAKAGAMILSE